MKRIRIIVFALILFIGYNVPVTVSANGAQSYIVIEASSGRILCEGNAHQRLPIASTTKVMTAIVAIEHVSLQKKIKIPKEAVGIEGSSVYLKEGELLTMEELLYGLMLSSGNDAAVAIALAAAGSSDNFVGLMNAKAAELGAKDTHFANPHGLHAKDHYSSAADMAKICAYAMKNSVFAEIASTIDKRITKEEIPESRFLHNKNRILSGFEGGNGIKIGYTKAAGRCLCAAAKRGDMQLICVVLNDPDWFRDAESLMEQAFSQYTMRPVVVKNQFCGQVAVENGKTTVLDGVVKETFLYPLKKDEIPYTTSRLVYSLKAPIEQGTAVGQVKLYLDEKQIGQVEIVSSAKVDRNRPPSLFDKIKEWLK